MLSTDYEYYLAQQILPPIERLCEPIEGTDKARLAECLGLDVQRYAAKSGGGDVEREFNTLGSQISDKERFSDCKAFRVRCSACGEVFEKFGGLLDDPVSIVAINPKSSSQLFLRHGLTPLSSTPLPSPLLILAAISRPSSSPLASPAQPAPTRSPPPRSPSNSRRRSAGSSRSTTRPRWCAMTRRVGSRRARWACMGDGA